MENLIIGLPGTNTLAYLAPLSVMKKFFITLNTALENNLFFVDEEAKYPRVFVLGQPGLRFAGKARSQI